MKYSRMNRICRKCDESNGCVRVMSVIFCYFVPSGFYCITKSRRMEKKSLVKRLLPYVVAILCFIAIPVVYFAPQFSGKTLRQGDMIQYKATTEEVLQHREKYGEDPQWLGNTFSGMPANLTNMQHDTMLIVRVKPFIDFLGTPASMIFLAMTAFFIMLLMWGLNPWAAIVPSIAYGLSTYFFLIIDAGHITKMWALAYTPFMMGGVFYAFRKNMWLGAAITSLFGALVISTNHTQIPYYFSMVLLAFWINEGIVAFKEKTMPRFLKATGSIAVAVLLAVAANSSSLYDTYQYSKDSIRGGSELTQKPESGTERGSGLDIDYATAWSYGKAESFNMYIPDFMGRSSGTTFQKDGDVAKALSKYGVPREYAQYMSTYWGDQPGTGGPTYIGAVIIFLCVLGLFVLRGRCKWWIVIVTLIALMLAWGRNFMWFTELFFNYFPGYNKFRVVAMILVIAEWSVPFIAALLLGKLWKEDVSRQQLIKALKYSVIAVGGVTLIFLAFGGALFTFTGPNDQIILSQMTGGADAQSAAQFTDTIQTAMSAERLSMMRLDALRSLVLILLTAGTVWLFAVGKVKKWLLVAILAILVCADLIPVNLRFLSKDKFVRPQQTEIVANEADKQILADTTLGFRVLNLSVSPFNDGTTSYFHRSIGGYHGAKMQRYQDLIDKYISRGNTEIVNMLNTRYYIDQDKQTGRKIAMLNPDANGAAWFVEEVILAASPDSEIEKLGQINTKRQAVVDRRFAPVFVPDPFESTSKEPVWERLESTYRDGQVVKYRTDTLAYIRLVDYKANHLTYETSSAEPGVAVFSEIYYDKGWKAFIDGEQTPIFRTDYVLRGLYLTAGEHKVEFKYRATNFDAVSAVTLIASIIIILGVVAASVAAIMCKRERRVHDARE